jgi:uncharacterized protein YycO
MEILISTSGGKYVKALPDGVKQAAMDDFFDEKGRLIVNKPYFIKSMVSQDVFWCNRVKVGFPYGGLVQFIEDGNVFVFNT